MGNKVNPIGMRLQVNRTWDSRWFANTKDFGDLLLEGRHHCVVFIHQLTVLQFIAFGNFHPIVLNFKETIKMHYFIDGWNC